MSGRIFLLFCVSIGVQSSPSQQLPLCKEDDSVCLTKNANIIYQRTVPGVPKLNIEVLDPMHLDEIIGDLSVLKYKLYNSTIVGSKNCEVAAMKLNLQMSKMHIDMNCPLLSMTGLYETFGQLLSIPIEGHGDYSIQCKGYYIQVDTDTKVGARKDGKKYLSIKSYKLNSELNEGMTMNLSNLFNGKQKELAESVLRFINKNWKPVVKELQGPVFNANVKKLVTNFNKYLKSIPLDQILQDI